MQGSKPAQHTLWSAHTREPNRNNEGAHLASVEGLNPQWIGNEEYLFSTKGHQVRGAPWAPCPLISRACGPEPAWRVEWSGVEWRDVRGVARVCPLVIDGSTELPPRPTMRTGGVPGYQARPAVLGICGEPIKGGRPLAGDYCTAFQLCFGANQGGGGSAGGERQRVRLPDRSTSIFERSRGLQSDCPWMG